MVTASMLGWPFAVFKWISATVTGLIGGLLTEYSAPNDPVSPINATTEHHRWDLWAGLEHAVDVLRSIWRWLVFGIAVSACLSVLVPQNAWSGLSELGPIGVAGVTLAFSIPLYVCAVASVPIAAALVASGFPPSAALIFLMAGPATNIATIGAIARTFGRRNVVIYLSSFWGASHSDNCSISRGLRRSDVHTVTRRQGRHGKSGPARSC